MNRTGQPPQLPDLAGKVLMANNEITGLGLPPVIFDPLYFFSIYLTHRSLCWICYLSLGKVRPDGRILARSSRPGFPLCCLQLVPYP